ncbi:AzlD domain-containing protein [Ferrovibrio sp.]|uniref:AzlD family protein n=1 Tax=Ferrovibrio sp. TaxID=1917215 RepID=UPI001B605F49|nr:AzlD domain-containing protein [Ferrovibrio sp.]MBP7064453.1 AzlD domain-containing protein [Ferrovibrio sp.]
MAELISHDALMAILAMAAMSYFCRASGFWMMRFVKPGPWVEAWLQSIPMAIMGAILAPVALNAGPAEWAGFAAAYLTMRFSGHDMLGAAAGVAAVALMRLALG